MTKMDPGYSEAAATLFTWGADKVLGGVKKALGWGWSEAQWAAAQDRYDAEIIKQYGEIRIFGQTTPKPLRDIFTDVYVLDTPTAHRRFSLEVLDEHMWKEDRSFSFRHDERKSAERLLNQGTAFFILGKPGSGKTTLLKRLAVREAQRGRWGRPLGKVPIFVSLKQYADARKPLLEFIVDQFAVCHFPNAAPFVETLLKSGKALVLFDGLDEVTSVAKIQSSERGRVAEKLEKFARQYSNCHIVVTCRIAAIDYTFEPAFTYLEVADFAPEQVEKFVRAWFWDETEKDESAALANRMLDEWRKREHKGIRDLARNPLLLTLLCLNYAETQTFPARRVEIYEEATEALLKKWDSSRQIRRGTLYKTLSLGRKRQMFARIAYDAFARNQILFPQNDLQGWLTTYLEHVPELPASIDIDAEAVLEEIIAQHGIFAQQAYRLISFSHLTFQEYYTAKYIADDTTGITLKPLFAHVTDDKWREVIVLTASSLPDATAFLSDFVVALVQLADSSPQLAARLQQIDEAAVTSQAGYRRPATRLYYWERLAHFRAPAHDDAAEARLRAFARKREDIRNARDAARLRYLERDPALARARERKREFDLEFARKLERELDLDREHNLDLARSLDLDLTRDLDLDRDLERKLELELDLDGSAVRKLARKLAGYATIESKRTALHEALARVEMPDTDAKPEDWMRYFNEWKQAVEASGELTRLRQLRSEAKALLETMIPEMALTRDDTANFRAYVSTTGLFYDCLQVAYTPDRRAFEERILEPPP